MTNLLNTLLTELANNNTLGFLQNLDKMKIVDAGVYGEIMGAFLEMATNAELATVVKANLA